MKNRLPDWFKQEIPDERILKISRLISEFRLNSVCREAKCPNISDCFRDNQATFMILGNSCTRNCRFCNLRKTNLEFSSFDKDEPYRISQLVKLLGLEFVVITSVTRDDLYDGGASMFVKTIELIRQNNKDTKIEVLIPDFQGKLENLQCVLSARPDIIAHNIETVERLYGELRPMADYQRSLDIIKTIKKLKPEVTTKSSIMLGIGETHSEVIKTIKDLRDHQCDCLTLGQYLAPTAEHYPVKEFVTIEQFREYGEIALRLGFKAVLSGPKVRSSYKAEELHREFSHA
ncbi:MAG: lipoyl synthase [Candidatus Omnitrophica bacterium]|nr:lipoyl synthase [Candidatus Omnitrophota bacterium]